ncbi:MAG: ribosome recycling factor [Chloroflexota bacterium]|nr:ribosome recycling factor [Chloroflexota bacterium]
MIDAVLSDAKTHMDKAVDALRTDLQTIRTGRASPALIERLHVEYYGVSTPLNQVASITVPEARMLVVQPWDKTALGAIEKAILKSDLGLNPTNDGKLIRVMIPYLSEERRRELIKLVHKKVEEGHVAVRNCRRDAQESLEKAEKAKEFSEDELKRAKERLQKITDSFIEKVDETGQVKQEEILEV